MSLESARQVPQCRPICLSSNTRMSIHGGDRWSSETAAMRIARLSGRVTGAHIPKDLRFSICPDINSNFLCCLFWLKGVFVWYGMRSEAAKACIGGGGVEMWCVGLVVVRENGEPQVKSQREGQNGRARSGNVRPWRCLTDLTLTSTFPVSSFTTSTHIIILLTLLYVLTARVILHRS